MDLTSNIDRLGLSDIGPFVEFIYYAVSKMTGDRILLKMLNAGLPVERGIKDLRYDKEMIWQFHTYEVV